MSFQFSCCLSFAGCSTGLSPRETRTQNYPAFVLSLYDNPGPAAPTPALTTPLRIAVAQIGEIAPPQIMLDRLRQRGELFTRVEGIPGVFEDVQGNNNTAALTISERQQVRDRVGHLQHLAYDVGMDYLFIYGGAIDHY